MRRRRCRRSIICLKRNRYGRKRCRKRRYRSWRFRKEGVVGGGGVREEGGVKEQGGVGG